MIARTWRGTVAKARAAEYHEYLLATGIPDLRATAGNLGVYLYRRFEDEMAHFELVSHWDGVDSIRAFAGEPVDRARYYPDDAEFLFELTPKVLHYEVLVAPGDDEGS